MNQNQSECEVMRNACERVKGIVTSDRNEVYGTPSENHEVTAGMWSLFLSRKLGQFVDLTGEDVCWLNVLQKASRQAHWSQEDNALDAAGYAFNSLACRHAEVQEQESPDDDEAVQDDTDRGTPGLCSEDCSTRNGGCCQGYNVEPFDSWLLNLLIRDKRVPAEVS